jgi:hypothetical protein
VYFDANASQLTLVLPRGLVLGPRSGELKKQPLAASHKVWSTIPSLPQLLLGFTQEIFPTTA